MRWKRRAIEFLGAKSGRLKAVQKQLGSVPGPDKPAAGKRFNEVKAAVEAAFAAASERLAAGAAPGRVGRALRSHAARRAAAAGAICTRSRRRSKSSRTSWAGWASPWPRARKSKTSGTISRRSTSPPRIRPAIRWRISIWPRRGVGHRRAVAAAQPDQHGANSRDGKHAAAGADHFARPRLSARHGRRHALSDVPSDRRPAGRSPRDDGRPEERAAAVRQQLFGRRRAHSLPALVLPVHRAERRSRHELARHEARRRDPLDRDGRGRHGRSQRAARPSATIPKKSPALPSAWASSASAPGGTA